MNKKFDVMIIIVVVLACLAFLVGIVLAGHATLVCAPPLPGAKPVPDPTFGGLCDAQGHPWVNPFLTAIVTPLQATLATYFGAAIGVGRAGSGTHTDPASQRNRLPVALRWGALLSTDNPSLALLQTICAYFYGIGLIIAGVYLYRAVNTPAHLPIDSPFIHLIVKTSGSALIGVIIGVVALALGVRPADTGRTRQS